ncbi:hypothetical protein ANASTE_00496 [Anaerofustis stercorihominis DSM 17244]|uniref:Uncharacterized protein n=1 Tax=Anaerofustis stercorihominis DSM 17244 TaxID=445971 RepID=B1C6Z9_9FIRM|nr:hypothetical protein ANASTE_00496 [Anaerofustis stercorihominis DSM 17244]
MLPLYYYLKYIVLNYFSNFKSTFPLKKQKKEDINLLLIHYLLLKNSNL